MLHSNPVGPRGRERLQSRVKDRPGLIGILHNVRVASIDNDTRMLFATVYDGDWDQYIDDFAAHPVLKPAIRCAVGKFGGLPGPG